MLEKTRPLDCKEIKPVNPEEINPEYSLEGLMLKLKLQYFGYLMQRTDSLEKTLKLGKAGGEGMTKDKMVERHHRFNAHELEQAAGDGEQQGSLACCNPWGHKALDMTE